MLALTAVSDEAITCCDERHTAYAERVCATTVRSVAMAFSIDWLRSASAWRTWAPTLPPWNSGTVSATPAVA